MGIKSYSVLEVDRADITLASRKGTRAHALRGVSFRLERGGSLAVVGESGSGKTTLLRTVLGLIPMDSGSITLLGKKLDKCSSSELIELRRQCGFIPQDPYGCLPPTLRVIDAVTEPFLIARGRKMKDEAVSKAENLLEELGLGNERIKASKLRSGLSGGQRQRVSVARALILGPKILLADEPTSMQDTSTRGDIIDILRKRISDGMSLVFVTHDLLLARAAAERTLVLYGGMACEYGRSDVILEHPVHPYSMALLAALPRLGGHIETAPGTKEENRIQHEGCPFRGKCSLADKRCRIIPPMLEIMGRKVACWKASEQSGIQERINTCK